MLINMAHALIKHEQIHTTLAKAKELRPYLERLITKAKNAEDQNKSHQKKILLSKLRNDSNAVNKLFEISPRYKTRQGGYLKIIKSGYRQGDNASMSYIQFVDFKPT